MIILGKLIHIEKEIGNYITYVFENLQSTDIINQYVMCTQFPNWNCRLLTKGDVGFVHYEEHIAGVDKWYNQQNKQLVNYNYNTIQFIKFIPKDSKDEEDTNIITL